MCKEVTDSLKGATTANAAARPYQTNVRFWHLADMRQCAAIVRFRGQSGHYADLSECPLVGAERSLFVGR